MTAIMSECTKYRYALFRDMGDNPLVFCMLNPSTADAERDDPTVAKCRKYAKSFGYSGLVVVNLYAFRATKPKDMFISPDPIGKENDFYITELCKDRTVICAWGNNANPKRALAVFGLLLKINASIHCLAITSKGQPSHPLYLKNDAQMMLFPPELDGYV